MQLRQRPSLSTVCVCACMLFSTAPKLQQTQCRTQTPLHRKATAIRSTKQSPRVCAPWVCYLYLHKLLLRLTTINCCCRSFMLLLLVWRYRQPAVIIRHHHGACCQVSMLCCVLRTYGVAEPQHSCSNAQTVQLALARVPQRRRQVLQQACRSSSSSKGGRGRTAVYADCSLSNHSEAQPHPVAESSTLHR